MNGNRKSRQTITIINRQLEAALDAHYPKASFVIDGKTYSTSELIMLFQQEDAAIAAVATARSAWQTAASAARVLTSANDQRRLVLKQALKQLLGSANAAQLQDFGFSVRTRTSPTTATYVAAAQKAAATRKARGTLGRKQRLAIKGAAPTATNGVAAR